MVHLIETDFSTVNIDHINDICNEYYYQYSLKVNGIYVSRSRNFSKLKTKKPKDWEVFIKLDKLCTENDIDYKKYIEFCIDEIRKIHTYIKLPYLLNIKYIRLFNEYNEIEHQYVKISEYIIKSSKKIIDICKENKLSTFTEFIKYIIKENKLGHYMKCGILSKYILVLIPNIKNIRDFFDTESVYELDNYVINKYDKLLNDAIIALEKNNKKDYINIIKKVNSELL